MVKEEPKKLYTIDSYKGQERISDSARIYKTNKKKNIQFEINTRTSSCGSIQILNLAPYEQYTLGSDLTKEERQSILNDIIEHYSDFNNIFFIDCNDGGIEQFFGDLGFKKIHSYGNTNTWNIVNFWIYDVKSIEEVKEMENEEEEGDYEENEW